MALCGRSYPQSYCYFFELPNSVFYGPGFLYLARFVPNLESGLSKGLLSSILILSQEVGEFCWVSIYRFTNSP